MFFDEALELHLHKHGVELENHGLDMMDSDAVYDDDEYYEDLDWPWSNDTDLFEDSSFEDGDDTNSSRRQLNRHSARF